MVYSQGKMFTAWRRDQTVYLDQLGQPEVALGKGKDVALASTRLGPRVIWTGSSGIELSISGEKKPRTLSATGQFPTLTALPGGTVLAAWENDGTIQIDRVR